MRVRRRLRGVAQVFALRARHRWAYLLALVLIVGEIVLAIAFPTPGLLGGVAIAALAIAAIGPVADGIELWRERRRLLLHDVSVSRLHRPGLLNAPGYRRRSFGSEHWIHSPEVDEQLRAADLPVEEAEGRYRLPDQAAAVRTFVLTGRMWGQTMFDGELVRLASDLVAPLGDRAAVIQTASYFDGECTNEMMDQVVERRSSVGPNTLVYEPMDLALDGRVLRDLGSSLCANAVGISTVAVTSDGRVMLPSQSDQNARSKRKLAPSGSGSAEMGRDFFQDDSLQDLIARAMTRELVEECFENAQRPPRVATKVIGFARILTRGGKPEFFGASYVDAPFASVRREKLFVQDVSEACVRLDSPAVALADLRQVRTRHRARFSLPLEINLALLEAWLSTDPAAALALIERGQGGR